MGQAETPVEIGGIEFRDKPQEACGVFGVITTNTDVEVGHLVYSGLGELQHRGEDGAGVVVNSPYPHHEGTSIDGHVSKLDINGVAKDGTIGVGHVRYSTVETGKGQPITWESTVLPDAQPFTLSHNGHISNIEEVAEIYGLTDGYASDSDCIVSMIGTHIDEGHSFEDALAAVLPKLEGAFSLVLSDGDSLYGVRDPNGFRPLVIGQLPEQDTWMFSSEDSALYAPTIGAELVREVNPGEIVKIASDGKVELSQINKEVNEKLCAFEYIYFARNDSTIRGRNVQLARMEMGRQLALEAPIEADIVIGVKDSGTDAAFGYSHETGIPRVEALGKSPFATRSFIQPSQQDREIMVRSKHRPNRLLIEGKRAVVVDDSIVRGTTMRTIVKMIREAGAAEVHLRIPAPAYRSSCFYGMATGDPNSLLAREYTSNAEMAEYLGADSLEFLSSEGLERAILSGVDGIHTDLGKLCMACMDGKYPTPIPAGYDLAEVA